MTRCKVLLPWSGAGLLLFSGCASRLINPPITLDAPQAGYRFETH